MRLTFEARGKAPTDVLKRKLTGQNRVDEMPTRSRRILIWKKVSFMIIARFNCEIDLEGPQVGTIKIDRAEVFRMAAAFRGTMSDEKFLRAIAKAASEEA